MCQYLNLPPKHNQNVVKTIIVSLNEWIVVNPKWFNYTQILPKWVKWINFCWVLLVSFSFHIQMRKCLLKFTKFAVGNKYTTTTILYRYMRVFRQKYCHTYICTNIHTRTQIFNTHKYNTSLRQRRHSWFFLFFHQENISTKLRNFQYFPIKF